MAKLVNMFFVFLIIGVTCAKCKHMLMYGIYNVEAPHHQYERTAAETVRDLQRMRKGEPRRALER